MNKQIKVVKTKSPLLNIKIGAHTLKLLNRFTKLDTKAKDTLVEEARYLLSNGVNPINTIGNNTGIAIGYVQSGKTMSFTTLTTLAIDNGFKIIVYFAGVKNNLLEQTVDRLKLDLETENDFSLNLLSNPTITNSEHIEIANSANNFCIQNDPCNWERNKGKC